jgi:copper oxidase (laccase) domain-containing protein
MNGPIVATSTTADVSMYNSRDPLDPIVITNRERFLEGLGIDMDQTTRAKVTYDREDFTRYKTLTSSEKCRGMRDDESDLADGLVVTEPGHAIMLPVADCVGAVFYDPVNGVLMVSHLGRHSLEQDGGRLSVEYLVKEHDSKPEDLLVWLTPAPGKDVYPIWALDNKGMKEVTFEQLEAAGIMKANITDNSADSAKDQNYFSYSEFLKGNRTEDGDHMVVAMIKG